MRFVMPVGLHFLRNRSRILAKVTGDLFERESVIKGGFNEESVFECKMLLVSWNKIKQDELFQKLYDEISENIVPVRPDRHYHRTKGQLAGNYSNTHKRSY